jgi:chemotaxis protein MotA
MDLATLAGLIGGFVLILLSMLLGSAPLVTYWDPPSVVVTIGGSFAALLVSNPISRVLGVGGYIGLAFNVPIYEKEKVIRELVSFSEAARKEGLLSLDDKLEDVEDEFLKSGMRLVVDGADPDVIRSILNNDLNQIQSRHALGINLIDQWGKFAPAFGMIGTLQGLVAMMVNLEDKAAIGQGMATALLTTFYGAIMANLVFNPIKNKLEDRDKEETLMKEIIIEGVLSIHNGENPRMLEQKLYTFVSPSQRAAIQADAEA